MTAARPTNRLPDVTFQGLPPGKDGAKETLKLMRRLALDGKTNIRVRQVALSLIAGLPHKDYAAQVRNCFEFVRDFMQYVKDVDGVETLHDCDRLLDNMQGDCDDKCVLLASLLLSIGHPCRFVAVAFQPDAYTHVLMETRVGQFWIPLETTENVDIGWYPPGVFSRLVIHI